MHIKSSNRKLLSILIIPPLTIENRYVVILKVARILTNIYDKVFVLTPFCRSELLSRLRNSIKDIGNVYLVCFSEREFRSHSMFSLLITLLILKLFYRFRPTIYMFAASSFLFILRIFGFRLVLFAGGFIKTSYFSTIEYLKSLPKLLLIIFQLLMAKKILVESPSVATFFELFRAKPIRNKILTGASLWIPEDFVPRKRIDERLYDICYAGLLDNVKGFPLFMASIRNVVKVFPRVKVAVASTGGPYERFLEKEELLRVLGIKGNIFYFKSIPYEEMPRFFNNCKILLLLSQSEGLPNVVQEAMACGCVVIAAPVGGIPDIIRNDETGVLVSDRRPEEVSKTLLKLLSDPKSMKIISENAYLYAKREYNFENILQRWRRIVNLIEGA